MWRSKEDVYRELGFDQPAPPASRPGPRVGSIKLHGSHYYIYLGDPAGWQLLSDLETAFVRDLNLPLPVLDENDRRYLRESLGLADDIEL